MTIHAYASQPHYVDHLAPIWQALDPDARGRFMTTQDRKVQHRARHYGIRPEPHIDPGRALTLIAGAIDFHATRRTVLVEHGAGQTYAGVDHKGWAGGTHRDRAVAFVVPNGHAAAANARRYPDRPNIIAAPRVEYLRNLHTIDRDDTPLTYDVVASRHWDSHLVPELTSAWPEYAEAIRALAVHDIECDLDADCSCDARRLALHAHPRAAAAQRRQAARWQLPYLETFEEVVATAGCYLIDNSSTAYEAAACDVPVVLLNATGYRRTVNHGLRFWDCLPGPMVDHPDQLEQAITDATTQFGWQLMRQTVTDAVYPTIEGSADLVARTLEELE